MGKNSAIGVLSFSVANRRRDFLLPSVAPSASLVLAETCQPGDSTPRFLAAQRSAVSSRREEVAQRKPFKRVFSGLFRKQKGCGPFEIPGVPDLQCLTSRAPPTYFGSTLFLACKHLPVCKMTDDYAAKQQIWGHLSAARHFCSAKILAGRAAMGDGGPHRRGGSPRAKKFPEEICFAPSRVLQICRTPDYRVLKSTRVRSTSTTIRIGQPRGARGAAPLCFRRSPEETIPKGFLWAISSRRLDTALLCAAKKRGVESPGWQASASGTLATAPRQEVKRQPRQARPNLNLLLKPSQGFYKLRCCSAAAANETRAGFDKPLHMLRKLA